MPVSYTSGQPSNPRRHPTCWASSQWSHTISRTPCHGAWTSAPFQRSPVHRVLLHGASNRDIHLYLPHSNSSVYLTTTYVRRSGRITNGMRIELTIPQASALSSPTPAPTPPKWPFQEETGSGSTTCAPVSDISAPACTNGVWPPLRSVSVEQQNKLSTMSSSNVQSIDLPMDCMAWRYWTIRQPNGCSTPSGEI